MEFIKKIVIDSVGVDLTIGNTSNYKDRYEWFAYECDEPLEVICDVGNGRMSLTYGQIEKKKKMKEERK